MSLSVHIGHKNKDILILGEGPTQGLGLHPIISNTRITSY